MNNYEDLIESKKRFDWVIAPMYETMVYQPTLGVEVQLTTVTDQIEGHPHRLEVRIKDFSMMEVDFDKIIPLERFSYKTRREALDDHSAVVEFWLNLLGRYSLVGRG